MILTPLITSLLQNVSILIVIILLYDYFWLRTSKPHLFFEKIMAGCIVGFLSVILMANPWVMQLGIIFDLRTVLLAITGLFLGFIPTLIAILFAVSFRLYIGGVGVYMGVVVILCAGFIGLGWKYFSPRWWEKNRIWELIGLGYTVHAAMALAILLLPIGLQAGAFNHFIVPGLTIYPWSCVILGILMDNRIQNRNVRKKRIELENMYVSLVENMPAGVFRKDFKGKFVYVNDIFCELKGLSKEEIIGRSPDELFDYEYIKEISGGYKTTPIQRTLAKEGMLHHQDILRNAKPITVEEVYKHADGSSHYFTVVKTPIFDDRGIVNGSQGMQFDVTAQKITEEALLHEQYLLKTFLDNSNDSIFFKDEEGRFVRVNKAQAESLGATDVDAVIGKSDFDYFSRVFAQKSFNDELEIMRTGVPKYNIEECIEWIDNRQKWVITSKFPYRNKAGMIIGTFGVAKDITPQKALENDLIKALNKVEESDRLKTAFLHNISHEIRTPMNSIVGFSGLLKDPEITQERKEHLADIVINSSNHLLSIIDDIVRIATIEAGQAKLNNSPVELNTALSIEFEQFQCKATERNIEFNYFLGLPDKQAIVILDETKFIQSLTNLLVNAFKFTKKGHIHFGYTLKGQLLHFFVEDTGIGIPIDKQEEVFKRFSQVDNMLTRNFGGSGLGLSICKAYIELMGGRIQIDKMEGEGTRFVFTLPYVPYSKETYFLEP